jgi:RNA polymerase sigma factor (sigma-70 family)
MSAGGTPTGPSDERLGVLMRAAQDGDRAAYQELLETITPRIRRIVARQRGFAGTEAVEDLVQDILLSLHKVRVTYDPARPFMPWLLAIVRNRAADAARRYARGAAREVALDGPHLTFVERSTNPVQNAVGEPDALRRAVRSLPARQRTAIELLKLQELSLKEAAAASGMSVGALKVATHRAMAALRKALGGGGGRS